MKKDVKFWVVLVAIVAFAMFVWPTPFEYKSVHVGERKGIYGNILEPAHSDIVKINRFTGQRIR